MLIVDTHAYVIAHGGDRRYPHIADLAPWALNNAVSLDELLPMMGAAGVQKATLIQALQAHGYDNSYTIESARRYWQRLLAVGMYDPQAGAESERLRMEVTLDHVRGARITPRDLNNPAAFETWQVASDLNVPILIAVARPDAYPAVIEMAQRYPKVRVILEGLGLANEVYEGPPFTKQQPLFDLARLPNLYLKWSTDQFEDMPDVALLRQLFQHLIDAFGAERLMWGSRFPYHGPPKWTYQRQVTAALDMLSTFSESEQAMIMGGAALGVWPELDR